MRPIIPFLAPLWAALTEPAYALMRLTAGAFLIPHGLWKLFGITGSQEEMLAFFQAIGLEPAFPLMIAVGLVETVGGACIALGLLTRPAAFAATVTTARRRSISTCRSGSMSSRAGWSSPDCGRSCSSTSRSAAAAPSPSTVRSAGSSDAAVGAGLRAGLRAPC